MELSELNNRFDYHAPQEYTKAKHEDVRGKIKYLAGYLNQVLPEGREKSVVFTHLEDVLMWANASIARSQD